MDAVLCVYLKTHGLAVIGLDEFVDASRAIALFGSVVNGQVLLDRHVIILESEMSRLIKRTNK